MMPHRPILRTATSISLIVSGTSVSSMSVFWTLCASVLGSWKVPAQHVNIRYRIVPRRAFGSRRLTAVERDVQSPRDELVDPLDDVFVLLEIDHLDPGLVSCEREPLGDAIDPDHAGRALQFGPARGELPDGAQALRRSAMQ